MKKTMRSIKCVVLFICLTLSLSAQDAKTEVKSEANDDMKLIQQIGTLSVSDILGRLNLSEDEKAAFLKGVNEALKAEKMDPAIKQNMAAIQKFVRARMNAAKMAKMAKITVPMDQEIETSSGEKTTLAKLSEGKKAVLLDFWATWCGPCMRLMPELIKKAEKLNPQGIVVAGMNTENKAKAEKIKQSKSITFTWLVEPNKVFSNLLSINSIPRMVLISPEGKVLFNGHPSDPTLKDAIAKVGGKL